MTRNLKALGLAVMAVLALGAVMASAAQAVPKFTGYETTAGNPKVHTTVKGTTEAGSVEIFKAGIGSVECHGTFEGTSLTGEGTELTITPTYAYPTAEKTGQEPGTCTTDVSGIKFPTHITGFAAGECDYLFTVNSKIKADEYTGQVHLKCAAGKQVKVEITKLAGGTKCTVTFGAQDNLNHVIYRNERKPANETHVTVESTVEKIKYTSAGGALNCGVADGAHEDGTYTSKVTLEGRNTKGEPVDIEVSGE